MSEKRIIHTETEHDIELYPEYMELSEFLADLDGARSELVAKHGDGVIRVGDGAGLVVTLVVVTAREETDAEYKRRCAREEKMKARKKAAEEAAELKERLTLKRLIKKYGATIVETEGNSAK